MYPIISIIGKSDSGKTSLLEELIAELKRRGYRVAVIKHSAGNFELDTAKKDTWRFTQAGSELSAINAANKLAIFMDSVNGFKPEELSRVVSYDYDLILTEGFKHGSYPKIEVHRKEQGRDLLSDPGQLLAVVTDEPLEVDVPQFSRTQIQAIVDFIENAVLAQQRQGDLELFVNGALIPTDTPLKNLLMRTLIAMVSGLKDVEEIKSLNISLRGRIDNKGF